MVKNCVKRFSVTMVSLLLIFAFSISSFAAENEKVIKTYTEDMGNGITAVVKISEVESMARTTARKNISKSYYSGSTYIGTAVLTATFNYNGSTSSAVSASGSGSGANGWSYSGQSTHTSGKSAYLTASLKNGSKTVGVSLSLTCDANGNVS